MSKQKNLSDKRAPVGIVVKRRDFLKGMSAIATLAALPFAISCKPDVIHDINGQLSDDEMATLIAVQNHLFPATAKAPGANEFNAPHYFTWVLTDEEKDPDERTFMKDGIGWVNEVSVENFEKRFVRLDADEKEKALRLMADKSWGQSWISVVLTQIFEALLSDPIYGSNNNQMGWKWLDHKTGFPQPTDVNKYPNILA